jgi:hypothetical protein
MRVVSLLVVTALLAAASSRTIKDVKNISNFYRKSNNNSEAESFFQGDIRLTPGQQQELNDADEDSDEDSDKDSHNNDDDDDDDHDDDDDDNGGTGSRFEADRWPQKGRHYIVPYVIDSSVGYSRRKIADMKWAMTMIEVFSCVRFHERSNQQNYLFITMEEDECWSYIGMAGGRDPNYSKQIINLGQSCSYGTMAHEFIHALGFFHQQSHPDRDEYVKIHEQNIKQGNFKENFVKLNREHTLGFSTPYDYLSIMHYSRYAFTKNGQPTIEALKEPSKNNRIIGQRNSLSPGDFIRINEMYKCDIFEDDDDDDDESDDDDDDESDDDESNKSDDNKSEEQVEEEEDSDDALREIILLFVVFLYGKFCYWIVNYSPAMKIADFAFAIAKF